MALDHLTPHERLEDSMNNGGRFEQSFKSLVGIIRYMLRLSSVQDRGHSMDSKKEEDQMNSSAQQTSHTAGSEDRAFPTVTAGQSNRDVSSWVLLFGSFLFVFNTWRVKHSPDAIIAKADMRMKPQGPVEQLWCISSILYHSFPKPQVFVGNLMDWHHPGFSLGCRGSRYWSNL